MKKTIAVLATTTLLLTGCRQSDGPNTTANSAPPPTTTTSAAPSTNDTATTTTASATSPVMETYTPTPGAGVPMEVRLSDRPAQQEMTPLGPNYERVVAFEDAKSRFWLCDKKYPEGSPENDFYGPPNGCAGPYPTQEDALMGLERGIHDELAQEFGVESDFDELLTQQPTPTPRNGDDIAAGIAESMGCESAVWNESIQGYEYVGCE